MKKPSHIELNGDTARVYLSGMNGEHHFAIISAQDVEKVSGKHWSVNKSPSGLYAQTWTTLDGRRVMLSMHRLIAGAGKGESVDHINGDTLCNLRANLRKCSHKENLRNRRKHKNGNTSKYKGVYWSKKKRAFVASICVNGKAKYLGAFPSENAAGEAYNRAAVESFGQFSRLNQITNRTTGVTR